MLFDDLMFSVEVCYSSARRFVNFRKSLNVSRLAYDSGGFAFLLGKIKQPPNPLRTCQIYRLLGYCDNDFLIQLDLPPQYYMSKRDRLQLIRKSAEFYWIMINELKTNNLLGVVHGWTEDELELSLELLNDPDRLCLGGNLSTMKVYAHDYIQKSIALGSYNVKAVLPEKPIALGSYANTKNSIAWSKRKSHVFKRVPRDVVYDRLATAMNMLRDDHEVFVLGGSGPNTVHLLFFLGARYVDGASWRLAAKLWRIYIPHLGEFSVGKKRIAKRLNDRAVSVMKDYFNSSPLNSMSFSEFLKKISSESGGFELRALWNAYALKIEEQIANEYANDPDRYFTYLRKRWSNSPYWRKILDFTWKRIKHPYVQSKLDIFLKVN